MRRNRIIIFSITFVSCLLGLLAMKTPTVGTTQDFDITKALAHVEYTSRFQHSVFDKENHAVVNKYVTQKAIEYTSKDQVENKHYNRQEYNIIDSRGEYDIDNILVSIEGKNKTGVLLVAHYDSRGHVGRAGELGGSYGAADDGYGIAMLLEIARIYGQKTDLENSIYLLFTDGEETGLWGSKLEAEYNKELMNKTNLVINIEARGSKGPAYMFETSAKNKKVIDLYKHANLPFTYSVATAVYAVMPNYTDFTEFLAIDKAGLNFAVLNSLYQYHSPNDNYANVSPSSLEHYASQILPMVKEYTNNAKYSDMHYFDATEDSVFFSILPNVLISYSKTFAIIINFIVLVVLIGLVIYLMRIKELNGKKLLKYTGGVLAGMLVLALFGFVVSYIIAFCSNVAWSLTYVKSSFAGIPTVLAILAGIYAMYRVANKYLQTKQDKSSLMLCGIIINLVLAIVTGFTLSGASFLFMLPAFFGVITLFISYFVKNKIALHINFGANLFIGLLIGIPLFYSLYLALTVGGLLAIFILISLMMSVVLPSTLLQLKIGEEAAI